MTLKQWFGLCRCRGARNILLSPAGLTAAFKVTLEMTGGKVPCQLECREGKRKGGGCSRERERKRARGYKWEKKNNGLTLSGWMLSQTEGEEEVNTSGTNKSAGTRERERERCSESPRRKERSDRGRVKLAYLPSGSAASQWRLTGKESNAPNRTHRGHRCARVSARVWACVHVRKRKENDRHR